MWDLLTKIDALNPCAFIANVRFVIVNEIPSIARFVKPYLPNNLHYKFQYCIKEILWSIPYGSFAFDGLFGLCKSRSFSHVSISIVTSSNCYRKYFENFSFYSYFSLTNWIGNVFRLVHGI